MEIEAIKQKYNAELALLLLCCRHYLKTANNSSIQLFLQQNKINWKQLYQLSEAHGIRPIVYNTLNLFKDFIKPDNLQELRNYCIHFNAFALNNKRELIRILNLLKQNNILAKPIKGIDFAENIYGNLGIREFSDNDVIIQELDIEKLINVMLSEGYRSRNLEFYKKFPKHYIRDKKDILFEKWNGNFRDFGFEFHFKTSWNYHNYPITFTEILGKNFFTELKNYNTIHYLKIMTLNHGLIDYYPNLRSIFDIAFILKKHDHSKIYGIDPVLNEFLDYGSKLSSELLNYTNTSRDINLSKKGITFCNLLLKNILGLKEYKRITVFKYMYFRIKNIHSVKSKAVQLKNSIQFLVRPNDTDLAIIKLPYYFLYYFTKPFRILIKIFHGKVTV